MSIEHKFIAWVKQICQDSSHDQVVLGIGDDAAVVDHGDDLTVVSTDLLVDGVHFLLGETPNRLIGRKALAVNLSDLAAMAAVAKTVVVSLLLPRSMALQEAQEIFGGLKDLADQFSVAVVGGDTNCHDGPLVISCAVTGTLPRTREMHKTWNMSAAKDGDVVLVSGAFGNSITGQHLNFVPRIELAMYLAERYRVHAATDITDSLSLDLASVAAKSGCGVRLKLNEVPVSDLARQLPGKVAVGERQHLQIPASVAAALFDGEDFELAITVTPETADEILADDNCPCAMTRIGSINSTGRLEVVTADGDVVEIQPFGYEH